MMEIKIKLQGQVETFHVKVNENEPRGHAKTKRIMYAVNQFSTYELTVTPALEVKLNGIPAQVVEGDAAELRRLWAESDAIIEESKTETTETAFDAHKDLETGITFYTLCDEVSDAEWKQVAHLFESDVELDSPDGREWNDSITLRWATRQPEAVKQILGGK